MNEALEILIQLLKRFEGCRLTAYRDIVGVWTIGWGETLGVKPGMVWTQDYADSRLRLRARAFLGATAKACPSLLTSPKRLAATASLAYNIGMGGFRASSVCRLAKHGEWQRAADSFLLWNKAGGKVVKGLTRRRAKEREVFLSG
jgi:lysozyme